MARPLLVLQGVVIMYYVYLLTDPRKNDEIFYCGKGKGDRWRTHLEYKSGNGKNTPTENKIKAIHKAGLEPGVKFLHTDIIDEEIAYRLEEEYIREHFENLTNVRIVRGPPTNTGNRTFKKSVQACNEQSKRLKTDYVTGKRTHWSKLYSKNEVSEKIAAGDPGKSTRGKPACNRTPIIETNTGERFETQTIAAKQLGIRQGDIANCLAGRQKTVSGYSFVYYNETNVK
jgi:hypothetical protein